MARLPRFVLVGHPQLMIIRGNNRDPIFIANEDYLFYLDSSIVNKVKSIDSDPIDSHFEYSFLHFFSV
ncbi:MAG: hypothetical protein B6247_09100 [Candidatus Parabeggiatoa sp. nov. 2]|nr:MAG: hypothetical protein B6247_09100 [Beggiatoa sp. 4572_84]